MKLSNHIREFGGLLACLVPTWWNVRPAAVFTDPSNSQDLREYPVHKQRY